MSICTCIIPQNSPWPSNRARHDYPDDEIICENCGALMDEIDYSGDNKDSEDLFFDDEGLKEDK